MTFRLQLSAFLVGTSLIATFSSPSMAQMFVGLLPPYQILAIVRSVGLAPTTPPMRSGPTYFVRAVDYNGRLMQVVVDGRSGGVLSVQPAAGGQVRLGYDPRIRVPPYLPDDFNGGRVPSTSPGTFGPAAPAWSPEARIGTGSMPPVMPAPGAHLPGGPTMTPPAPGGRTADLAPAATPVPRARPAAASEQTHPGVAAEPSQKLEISPSHEVTPPDQKPREQTTSPPPVKPGGGSASAFPPVTPLE